MREAHVAHFTRCVQSHVELRVSLCVTTLFLVEQSKIAMSISFPSAIADFAEQSKRPFVVIARLIRLAQCVVDSSEVAEDAAFGTAVSSGARQRERPFVVGA
jgi:hypothetical protein